jgi:hypothetical protein
VADTETVDLAFLVTGGPIPVDHGYAVYSAISRRVPDDREVTSPGCMLIRMVGIPTLVA